MLYARSEIARARRLAYYRARGRGASRWRRPTLSHRDIGFKHGEVTLASAQERSRELWYLCIWVSVYLGPESVPGYLGT